jgi:hypothetical protein
MKPLLVIAVAAAVGLTVPALAQQNQRTLSITATPTTVKFGGTTTLAGKLTGSNVDGRNVRVDEDVFPVDSFQGNAGNATTNATGDWTLAVKPTANTRYRASQGNTDSPTVDVLVRPTVSLRLSDRTPRRGQRVRFRGQVCPEHDGTDIALQRRTSSGWRTVASPTLSDVAGSECSSFSVRRRVRRDSRFRARFAGDADHLAATSPRRRANVHG